MAEDVTEDHDVPEPDDGASAEGTLRRWLTVVIGFVLLALAVSAVVWGLQQRSELTESRAERDRQRDAVLVASGFVEALMSYDHEDLDAQQAAVDGFATEQFRTEYADAFTNEVRDQIVAEEASSSVTVQDVYVTFDDDDELSAIVHARSEVSSGRGASAELESYLLVRLVRLEDRWQVDELTSLGSRDLSPLPGQPTDEDSEETESDG